MNQERNVRFPSAAKARIEGTFNGTAEAVPLQKLIYEIVSKYSVFAVSLR